ncbi:hypothetical protein KFE25_012713 [Diacronema lutheri]|uniref:Uncharacterized protein n=1 Tax=Diacronema lutheri TaxID=2081491 RepID=A0A8J5X6G3_DIALT|nr:hypothetical protein KFE25_012713 [Diacronema lutheri]
MARFVIALALCAVPAVHTVVLGGARARLARSAMVRRLPRPVSPPLLVRASSTGPDELDAAADAALMVRLEAEVQALTGSGLDAVLNPMKLVNLERDLIKLRAELETLDASSAEASAVRAKIEDKERSAGFEKRTVMKGWLRALFRGQAYLSILISALVSYDALPGAGHLDIGVRVLGFWSWWLFTIPSLRSIKPLSPQEKGALNWAFLAVLFVSLAAPVATKEPSLIWWADAGAVGLCYAYFFTVGKEADPALVRADSDDEQSGAQRALKFALRAIDFGSGVERGQRSSEKTAIERQLEESIAAQARAKAAAAKDE